MSLSSAILPPFCTEGPDQLPDGPPPGSPESEALAAWEVLTRARLARSTGSGRMSLLGRHRSDGGELTRERSVWIAVHAFEGAAERWDCRRALWPAMTDAHLARAIVQEMGGPAEADEMTTLGFWLDQVGFFFDSRGPRLEITDLRPSSSVRGQPRRVRIGPAHVLLLARRMLGIADGPAAPGAPRRPSPRDAAAQGGGDQLHLF